MHLSKIRHGDGLLLQMNINVKNSYIAPLGLQMLVENAIKHNIISDDMPLKIEINTQDGYLVVKNNVQKKSSSVSTSEMGLENLKNRYTYLSDKPVKIIAADNYFIVKLPLIEN